LREGRSERLWYKECVDERLREYLADKATLLVRENFTGVRSEWWWERRLDGGIVVCQELDPETVSRELSGRLGRETPEVRRVVVEELGLDDAETVVLTFEIPGDTPASEAASMLAGRSTPEGLASGLYRRVEDRIRAEGT
jgi:hypothetical protein